MFQLKYNIETVKCSAKMCIVNEVSQNEHISIIITQIKKTKTLFPRKVTFTGYGD